MARIQRIFAHVKANGLILGTLAGAIIGGVFGIILRPLDISQTWIDVISYPGEIFMRALQLLVLPLIISSLIFGSGNLNAKLNGKIALRALTYFSLTSLFCAAFGVALAVILKPGGTFERDVKSAQVTFEERKNTLLDNMLDLGRNIVPSNIFESLFQQTQTVYEKSTDGEYIRTIVQREGSNSLGIIAFCLTLGTILGSMGSSGRTLLDAIGVIDKVMMMIITGLIKITPLGVGSILASKILTLENLGSLASQLGQYMAVASLGLFIYQFIFLQLLYFLILRKNPFKFYIGLMQAILVGFSACSSSAALPVSFQCVDKLGVNPRISKFILPIGASLNKDGTGIFISVASVFIAQLNGMTLSFGDMSTIALTSSLVSMACATIPSSSLALMFIVLNSINCPTKDIGLLFAVDFFLDRLRTTDNILGDCYAAAIIEKYSQEEIEQMDMGQIGDKSSPTRGNPDELKCESISNI